MYPDFVVDSAYVPSDDVVARDIEGEFILVPLASGIGNMEDELYILNETGKAIWQKLDGKKILREIAVELNVEFDGPLEEIERDVIGLVGELFKRRMVVRS